MIFRKFKRWSRLLISTSPYSSPTIGSQALSPSVDHGRRDPRMITTGTSGVGQVQTMQIQTVQVQIVRITAWASLMS
jgi:hypothetical protein